MRFFLVLVAATAAVYLNSALAEENPFPTIESTYKAHTRAVQLAREGKYTASLKILTRLLKYYPKNYPLQRDTVLVLAWKGECWEALRRFRRIRNHPQNQPYLLEVVGECMLNNGRNRDAIEQMKKWLKKYPESPELRYVLDKVLIEEAAKWNTSPELKMYIQSDESDQGFLEKQMGAEFNFQIARGTRLFFDYFLTRTHDLALKNGEQDRVGIGIRHRFSPSYYIEQSFSKDIDIGGQGRSATQFNYTPSDTWNFEAFYTNFALDIPIRAKAANIEANNIGLKVTFDLDESWYWHLSLNRYDFTDTNRRRSLYTEISYPIEKKPLRTQRIGIEYYVSLNSFNNAVYFNPSRDRAVTFVHQFKFFRKETRFKRRTDQFFYNVGTYDQEGFQIHTRWGVGFGQDFELSESSKLEYNIRFERNVYDGSHENEISFELTFVMRM